MSHFLSHSRGKLFMENQRVEAKSVAQDRKSSEVRFSGLHPW